VNRRFESELLIAAFACALAACGADTPATDPADQAMPGDTSDSSPRDLDEQGVDAPGELDEPDVDAPEELDDADQPVDAPADDGAGDADVTADRDLQEGDGADADVGADADADGPGDTDDSDVADDGPDADLDPDRPRFVDISHQTFDIDPREEPIGVGACIVDVDGDDLLDIVWTSLLINEGDNVFRDVTVESGMAAAEAGQCSTFADVDNDGDADLYTRKTSGHTLLINDGEGNFTDAGAAWGLSGTGIYAAAAFGDFDNDGLVDLYEVINRPPETGGSNHLYWNRGDHFERVTATPSGTPGDRGRTLAATFLHWDDDDLPDLWVVNDYGFLWTPSQLYRNLGPDPDDASNWLWQDISVASGMDSDAAGMGAALGDVDNDGDFDVYIPNVADNPMLIVEDGVAVDRRHEWGALSGHFTDPRPTPAGPADWPDYDPDSEVATLRRIAEFCAEYCDPSPENWSLTSWGGVFFDADQDGWIDLFVENGFVGVIDAFAPEGRGQPVDMYMNQSGSHFERAPESIFPDHRGVHRGAAVGDLDRDGDLDLVFIDIGVRRDDNPEDAVNIYENRLATGNWLQLELEGTISNRDAVGARISLEAGGITQIREVDGGRGFSSASQRAAHFGLGDAATVDRISVRWPAGAVTVLNDIAANQRLSVVEPP